MFICLYGISFDNYIMKDANTRNIKYVVVSNR